MNSSSIIAGMGLSEPTNWGSGGLLERTDVSLNDPAIWDVLGGSRGTTAGVSVNEDKAMTLGLVWQAVSMISSGVATLPLGVHMTTSNGGCVPHPTHPAERLLSRVAMPGVHSVQFWRRMMCFALLWNNAYALIVRNSQGQPVELIPLLPDRTCKEWHQDTQQWVYTTELTEGPGRYQLQSYFPSQVLHIQGPSIDRYENDQRKGEFLYFAREALGLAISQRVYKAHYFRRGGRVGGILQLPIGISKVAADRLEEGFRKTYENVDNAFKTFVGRDGVSFQQTQMTPEESQMSQADADMGREVARWFNLAPSRLGVPDSQSYGSKAEDNRAYYEQTLQPWCETVIKPECEIKILGRQFEDGSHCLKYNTWHLLKGNPSERMQLYRDGVEARILNPNECRGFESWQPYEGGDAFENPNTTSGAANVDQARELLASTMAGCLAVVGDRAKKAAKGGTVGEFCVSALPEQLLGPAEKAAAVARVVEDSPHWQAVIYGELLNLIRPRLARVADPDAVAAIFDDVTTKGVAAVAAKVLGGKDAQANHHTN